MSTLEEARKRFAACANWWEEREVQDFHDWLRVWSGSQWGEQAPNRLFGAWVNDQGEAV